VVILTRQGIVRTTLRAAIARNDFIVGRRTMEPKKALVVIDMQGKFYRGFGKVSMDQALDTITSLVGSFRKKSFPIVWIQHENKFMGLSPGEDGFELIDKLVPVDGEKRVVKRKGNAFIETDLEGYLRSENVQEIHVCGYAAEACVNKTYNGGRRIGFSVFKVRKGIASGSRSLLWLFEKIGDYRKVEEILS
jgi:nicotinamidase-related amidase